MILLNKFYFSSNIYLSISLKVTVQLLFVCIISTDLLNLTNNQGYIDTTIPYTGYETSIAI